MQALGYIASALIGLSLGLTGGGGTILTLPVLVYLFGLPPVTATAYSIVVVGTTSLVGAVVNFQKRLVNIRIVLLFGVSSVATVYLARHFVFRSIPEQLGKIGRFEITMSMVTMIAFAVLMILAAFSMISKKLPEAAEAIQARRFRLVKLLSFGVLVGLITGFLGAGGGFILIPVLVLLVGLPMKEAIGTSLTIITLNSLVGFAGDLGHMSFDWMLLGRVALAAMAGILVSGILAKRLQGDELRNLFGWFVMAMGVLILGKEIIWNLAQ